MDPGIDRPRPPGDSGLRRNPGLPRGPGDLGDSAPPAATPPGRGDDWRRAAGLCALGGWLLWALVAWATVRRPAVEGESVGLRWGRAWAEHPVRTPLALSLVLLGLVRLRAGAEGPGFGPRDGL